MPSRIYTSKQRERRRLAYDHADSVKQAPVGTVKWEDRKNWPEEVSHRTMYRRSARMQCGLAPPPNAFLSRCVNFSEGNAEPPKFDTTIIANKKMGFTSRIFYLKTVLAQLAHLLNGILASRMRAAILLWHFGFSVWTGDQIVGVDKPGILGSGPALARPLLGRGFGCVTALFDPGDDARLHAWLENTRRRMNEGAAVGTGRCFEFAVYEWLSGAEAPSGVSSSSPLLPTDPTPIIKHAAHVPNRHAGSPIVTHGKHPSISAIYLATELYQLTSPARASAFLDLLLEIVEHAFDETALFATVPHGTQPDDRGRERGGAPLTRSHLINTGGASKAVGRNGGLVGHASHQGICALGDANGTLGIP
ncbi:hypothetical protein EDB19DRAFT_1947193 [Suillus lakei]|nr:hypothetical protein EDB19DRAFT_1947193 [Suillus lakei]